ncbi:putative transcription factor SOX-14 [Hypsizygus marmoreus]|uniref:Transcription factor SOX-14 n=1 Tax=Hypsizygus marmoreus TaxID=39966 RepID=A0A369KDV0_HYPMA|nr:putative transcription factor SOX-14 [Hypsizygus marmoreus]
MPAFRNVKCRSSGRIWKQVPIFYDDQGWETIPGPMLTTSSHNDASSPHSSRTSATPPSADADFGARPAVRMSKPSRRRDADHVPRPRNAFIIYRSHVCKTSSGHDQNQISIRAGKAWKALNKEEKQPFILLAEKEKRDHQEKFPNYTYTPGSKSHAGKRKAPRKVKTPAPPKKVVAPRVKNERRSPSAPLSFSSRESTPAQPAEIAAPALLKVESSPSATPEPMLDLTKLPTEPVFSKDWTFVPTDDIPPLELSPSTKPEKEEKLEMSLRPRSYHIIDEPFGPKSSYMAPRMMGSYLPQTTTPPESNMDSLDVASSDVTPQNPYSYPPSPQFYSLMALSSQPIVPAEDEVVIRRQSGGDIGEYDPLSGYDFHMNVSSEDDDRLFEEFITFEE